MRYPEATLRNSGTMMMTTTIRVHVTFDMLFNAFLHELSYELGDRHQYIADMTKAKLWSLTVTIAETSGINWFPEGRDIDSIRDTLGDEITARINELFPELKGGKRV